MAGVNQLASRRQHPDLIGAVHISKGMVCLMSPDLICLSSVVALHIYHCELLVVDESICDCGTRNRCTAARSPFVHYRRPSFESGTLYELDNGNYTIAGHRQMVLILGMVRIHAGRAR